VTEFVLPVTANEFARVGISIGASCYPGNGNSFDEMIVAADKGMYATKSQHRKALVSENGALPHQSAAEAPAVSVAGPIAVELIPERELGEASYVVELDETHIVSSAVN
jgi:hypothetical protein